MTDTVFPEDEGTGGYPDTTVARQSDFNDAAHFAAHTHAGRTQSALLHGASMSLDSGTLTVNGGMIAFVVENVDATNSSTVHDRGTFIADFDERSLSVSGHRDIHVIIDLSSNDTISVVDTGHNNHPSNPSLKIGEVDTNDGSVSDQWYLDADGSLSFPSSSAITNADVYGSLERGNVAYDRNEQDIYIIE